MSDFAQLLKAVVDVDKANLAGRLVLKGALEDQLQHKLGTRVKIIQGKKRGKVVIDFYSNDDLTRIVNLITPSF